MAELRFPGVYVEERSFRAKTIEGVATLLIGVSVGWAAAIAAEAVRRRCRHARP